MSIYEDTGDGMSVILTNLGNLKASCIEFEVKIGIQRGIHLTLLQRILEKDENIEFGAAFSGWNGAWIPYGIPTN